MKFLISALQAFPVKKKEKKTKRGKKRNEIASAKIACLFMWKLVCTETSQPEIILVHLYVQTNTNKNRLDMDANPGLLLLMHWYWFACMAYD